MELGGKSPNVVFADADLDAAAKGAINAIFYGKGELCSAGSRLLVEESIHDALLEKVVERAKKMAPGDPLDPKTRLGLARLGEAARERRAVRRERPEAKARSSSRAGTRASVNGKGAFFEATVFDGVTPQMTIAREEIFGPVLSALTFRNEEEAIAIGNSTIYGLAAAVWTRDIKKALRSGPGAQGRDRLDQRLQLLRSGAPLRRLQGVRVRPGARALRARGIHAGQEHLDRLDLSRV